MGEEGKTVRKEFDYNSSDNRDFISNINLIKILK